MRAMITPTQLKSRLVDGFDDELRVARIALAEPHQYRDRVSDEEWGQADMLDGRRRVEFLAGRAAARVALNALLGPTAVAAVGHVACLGIDLCDRDDAIRVRRVALRFLCAEETALADRRGADGWARRSRQIPPRSERGSDVQCL